MGGFGGNGLGKKACTRSPTTVETVSQSPVAPLLTTALGFPQTCFRKGSR
jgi:hypothetical protein